MTLLDFLNARLGEDQKAAEDCGYRHWYVLGPPAGHYAYSSTSDHLCGSDPGSNRYSTISTGGGASLHHAARHDPARTLAEIDAKRRLIALHAPEDWTDEQRCAVCQSDRSDYAEQDTPDMWPCATLRLLAAPYADHPDYDEAWRV